MTDTITQTLTDRGNRYGPFIGHAEVTQRLKRVMAEELAKRGKPLADDQWEALEMIAHKIGRIINGDPDYDDSWVDIAGYAKLVSDRLQGTVR
ncbi:MAG: hypothetical protein JSR30_12990 [Proteobacteria bacterium]|nr:hypothetical protein [Pseudomonadota bacterium]